MTDEFLKQYDKLSTEALADAIRSSRDQNVVLSPLSIYILLEMLADFVCWRNKKRGCRRHFLQG